MGSTRDEPGIEVAAILKRGTA